MKKFFAVLLAVIMALSAVACGGAAQEAAPAATEAAKEEAAPAATEAAPAAEEAAPAEEEAAPEAEAAAENPYAGQTLKISAFEGGYGSQYIRDIADLLEAAYPGVTVEIQASPNICEIVRPQMIAGEYPDVYIPQSAFEDVFSSLVGQHMLEDLTDVFEQPLIGTDTPLKDALVDGFLTRPAPAAYGDGSIICAPIALSANSVYYNATLFEKNGWEVPKTWDEFFALGDKAKEQGIALFAYPGANATFYTPFLWQNSIGASAGMDALNDIMNYKVGSVSGNEDVVKVMENFAKIGQEGYLMDGCIALNHTQCQSEFLMDKCLFYPCGMWLPNEMADAPRTDGFKFAMTAAPSLRADDTRVYDMGAGEGACIPTNAEHKELAKEFIRILYSDEAAVILAKEGTILGRKDITEVASEYISPEQLPLLSISDEATGVGYSFKTLENSKVVVDDYVLAPINSVMSGTVSTQEWIDGIEECFGKIQAGE